MSERVIRETRFRTPSEAERVLGLWIDRVGSGRYSGGPPPRRKLGQYGAVAVVRGDGYFEWGRGRQRVFANDVMLLFPDVPARYYPDGAWFTRWIVWGGEEAVRLETTGYLDRDRPMVKGGAECVISLASALGRLDDLHDRLGVLERKAALLEMIAALRRIQERDRDHPRRPVPWAEVAAFIRTHRVENFAMAELAARFHVSETHLRREFKRYSGCSPVEFRTTARLSLAKERLAEGRPIKEVAAQVGYGDVFHFMRVFKRVTGQTAGQFMRDSAPA